MAFTTQDAQNGLVDTAIDCGETDRFNFTAALANQLKSFIIRNLLFEFGVTILN